MACCVSLGTATCNPSSLLIVSSPSWRSCNVATMSLRMAWHVRGHPGLAFEFAGRHHSPHQLSYKLFSHFLHACQSAEQVHCSSLCSPSACPVSKSPPLAVNRLVQDESACTGPW